jgi:hypothetical protein
MTALAPTYVKLKKRVTRFFISLNDLVLSRQKREKALREKKDALINQMALAQKKKMAEVKPRGLRLKIFAFARKYIFSLRKLLENLGKMFL